jgi:hypothetical protein
MKTSEAFWQFLPEGLDELFEMARFEKTDKAYDIWLDEKKKLSDEDYRNPNIVARGHTDYVTVQDYFGKNLPPNSTFSTRRLTFRHGLSITEMTLYTKSTPN